MNTLAVVNNAALMMLDGPSNNTFMSTVVAWVAGVAGAIIAIFLIISIVKNSIAFAKGNGSSSIWKIIGEALFLIVLIGLVFLATNYSKLGETAQGIGEAAVTVVQDQAQDVLAK